MFSSWARILNVQERIIERTTTADKSVYASIRCTWYTQCRPTHPIPGQCWARPASQPIAGSMPVTDANRIRHWPNIKTELGDCPVFALTSIRVTLYPPKGHHPDITIHWPNCEIMLGHRLRRWATYISTKTSSDIQQNNK